MLIIIGENINNSQTNKKTRADLINSSETKIERRSLYRVVNSFRIGYKNQPINC
jgi:hypothetical protein